MGISTAISPRLRDDADGISGVCPFLWRERKGIEACFLLKPLEFEGGGELRIILTFPDS